MGSRLWSELHEVVQRAHPDGGVPIGHELKDGAVLRLSRAQRRLHTAVFGKTGTGKTTLLKNLILADIDAGRGVCLIDVHGDLVDAILPRIPDLRRQDVVLFDPSSEVSHVLNVLEAATERERNYLVEELVDLMYNLYDPLKSGIVGPQFEQASRYAALTILLSDRVGSIIDVPSVIASDEVRQGYLNAVPEGDDKRMLNRFWVDEWGQKNAFHKSEILCFVTSKYERFRSNTIMRRVLSAPRSSFDMRSAMDDGKIVLCKLAKGYLEDLAAQFLGSLLLIRLFGAALSRADMPPERRRDFYLYLDEFHNFPLDSIRTIPAESRKYGLVLTLATQNLKALKENISEAVLANTSNLISFRVGHPDAVRLSPYFQPYFRETDLINLPNYQAIVQAAPTSEPLYPARVKMML